MSLERVPLVNLKKEDDLNVVTISNGVNNSLTNEGLRDMLMALTEALSGNSNPIMITGSGERAFSVGYSASCTKISDKMHLEVRNRWITDFRNDLLPWCARVHNDGDGTPHDCTVFCRCIFRHEVPEKIRPEGIKYCYGSALIRSWSGSWVNRS